MPNIPSLEMQNPLRNPRFSRTFTSKITHSIPRRPIFFNARGDTHIWNFGLRIARVHETVGRQSLLEVGEMRAPLDNS